MISGEFDRIAVTAREYDAMVRAVHALERAIVSPAPGREEAWKQRAGAALTVVVDELRQHRESAEKPDGLVAAIEAAIGRPRELSRAISGHESLVESAGGLLTDLADDALRSELACEDVRERVVTLTAALRRHQAVEADLILQAFDQDIGPGD